eukprot:PhF_6_TR27810/c0_g1_i2/m.40552
MYLRSRVTLSSEESDTSSVPPPTHNNVLVPDVGGGGGDLNTIPLQNNNDDGLLLLSTSYLVPLNHTAIGPSNPGPAVIIGESLIPCPDSVRRVLERLQSVWVMCLSVPTLCTWICVVALPFERVMGTNDDEITSALNYVLIAGVLLTVLGTVPIVILYDKATVKMIWGSMDYWILNAGTVLYIASLCTMLLQATTLSIGPLIVFFLCVIMFLNTVVFAADASNLSSRTRFAISLLLIFTILGILALSSSSVLQRFSVSATRSARTVFDMQFETTTLQSIMFNNGFVILIFAIRMLVCVWREHFSQHRSSSSSSDPRSSLRESHRTYVWIKSRAATLCEGSAGTRITYTLSSHMTEESNTTTKATKNEVVRENVFRVPESTKNNACRMLSPFGNIVITSDTPLLPFVTPRMAARIHKQTLPLLGLFILGLQINFVGFLTIVFEGIPYSNAYHYVGSTLDLVVVIFLILPFRRTACWMLMGHVDFWVITIYSALYLIIYCSVQQRYHSSAFDPFLYVLLPIQGSLLAAFFLCLDATTHSLTFRKLALVGVVACLTFVALSSFSFMIRLVLPIPVQHIFFEPLDLFVFTTTRQTLFSAGIVTCTVFLAKAGFNLVVRQHEFLLLHVPVRRIDIDVSNKRDLRSAVDGVGPPGGPPGGECCEEPPIERKLEVTDVH